MEEKVIEENGNLLIRNVFYAVKRNIVLILALILFFTAGGFVYANLVKPNYTASVKVRYMVDDSKGGTVEDINAMRAYIDTVIDFVDEGVVVDRANYYYTKWCNDSISDFKIEDIEKEYADKYSPESNTERYIEKSNISVATSDNSGYTSFFFSVRYTDSDRDAAIEKAQILALAFKNELQLKDSAGDFVYFSNLEIDVASKGFEGVSSNVSKNRIIIIGALIGVVVAAVVVYLVTVFDKTVNSKKDLEELTQTKAFASLGDQGGKK